MKNNTSAAHPRPDPPDGNAHRVRRALELSQDALLHSFHRLARDVGEVIKSARCQR